MKIIIIGAGPGGYETAVTAAKKGMEVIIISEGPLGGTCLNEGCIPTKTFVHAVENVPEKFAQDIDSYVKVIQERKTAVVAQLNSGIEFLLKNPNIKLIFGKAQFVSNKKIKVLPSNEEFEADKILIATGSVSASLPIKGTELCASSKDMLEMTSVPKRLCIIGGGVIGLEFANIFNRLGTKVTVIEYCKQILPRFDTDIAKRLKQILVAQGIEIKTGVGVNGIEKNDDGLCVNADSYCCCADVVLMAVGRRANVNGLGLENTNIDFNGKGIIVDENMQTSVQGVYAIGDVVGGMMLAHVASFQGKRALNHILGEKDRICFNIVPAAVFTTPEVATVGMTEDECKNLKQQTASEDVKFSYQTFKSFFRTNGKALSMNEIEGYCKIIAREDGLLLGAHIIGTHSSDIIHEIAALMNMNATIDDMRNIIHAHPTLAEIVQTAIQ